MCTVAAAAADVQQVIFRLRRRWAQPVGRPDAVEVGRIVNDTRKKEKKKNYVHNNNNNKIPPKIINTVGRRASVRVIVKYAPRTEKKPVSE